VARTGKEILKEGKAARSTKKEEESLRGLGQRVKGTRKVSNAETGYYRKAHGASKRGKNFETQVCFSGGGVTTLLSRENTSKVRYLKKAFERVKVLRARCLFLDFQRNRNVLAKE